MTVIRRAVVDDIPSVVEMARDIHAESPRYRTLDFTDAKVRSLAFTLIGNHPGGVLVAEDGGRLVGMLAFYVTAFFFGSDTLASDLVMYLRPEKRGGSLFPRMVKAFEAWADEYDVKEKQLSVSTMIDSEKVVAVLERMGYAQCATGTMKRK